MNIDIETNSNVENKQIISGINDIKEEAEIEKEKGKNHFPEYKTFPPGDDVYNQHIDPQDIINSKVTDEKPTEINEKQ